MALTNAEKQKAFRDRKLKNGEKKREFYLNDKKFKLVKKYIKSLA